MVTRVTVSALTQFSFDISDLIGADAGFAVLNFDGSDPRVVPRGGGAPSNWSDCSVSDIVSVYDDDGNNITEDVKSELNKRLWTPRVGLTVARVDDHPKDVAIAMADVLDVMEYDLLQPRIAAFLGELSGDEPLLALKAIDRGARLWWEAPARDLILTMHDYMQHAAPEGTYFGYQEDGVALGFWAVRPPEEK